MAFDWDLNYVNSAPVNVGAPTTDNTATDPDSAAFEAASGAAAKPFGVTDRYLGSTGAPTDLLLWADGGAATAIEVYVYSRQANKWLLLATALTPSNATVPTRVQVPPYSRIYIRIQTIGLATAIYGAFDVG